MLYAALVLLAGAAFGAGGFFLEQATANWRPRIVRTESGWRVSEVRQLGIGGLALCGDRIAWQDGPSILLLDLRSGGPKLLGPGATARATWAPAVSARYVVWFEAARGGASSAEVWTYDTATRRRRRVAGVDDVLSLPSAFGSRAVWCTARNGQSRIVGVDLMSGKDLAVASEYGQPVIDGSLVVWARSTGGGLSSFVVADLTQGRTWTVAPSGFGSAAELTGLDLSGRVLVWGQKVAQTGTGRIVAQSVDTGAASVVAETGAKATAPSVDGDIVVWAEPTPDGAASRVMGRRLSGGPTFDVARVDGTVVTALVSGDTVAWLVDNGDRSPTWIETMRLPR